MSEGWVEVSYRVPAELVDQLAETLYELSGNGVCIDNQTLDTFSLDSITEPSIVTLKAYFEDTPEMAGLIKSASHQVDSLCSGNSGYSGAPPALNPVHQEDWATTWKQHFHASPVGRTLLLKPSWEAVEESEKRIVIEIDPGMAFGTGTHATTRLCLETLERIFDNSLPFKAPLQPPPLSVLDVGTGSGVLAIAARKLGAGRISALDIDPEAVKVALENIHNNGIFNDIEISTTPLNLTTERYPVVLANILAEDLIRMASELSSRILPGGVIVLSGILVEREQGVLEAYQASGLTHIETMHQQEWSCIVLQRAE